MDAAEVRAQVRAGGVPEVADMEAAGVEEASRRLAYGREEVRGAILLASGGTYNVVIANLPQCRAIATEFEAEASRAGVALIVEEHDGRVDLRVGHR